MSRLSKKATVSPVTDLNAYREGVRNAEYQGGRRHHGAYADDAHSAVMSMIDRLAGTLAAHDENLDTILACVDWGDGVDYGDDISAPSEELRSKAAAFLKRMSLASAAKLGGPLVTPDVSPTVDGNIDIHWGAGEERELLVCVRAEGLTSYFGKAPNGDVTKGTLAEGSDGGFLAVWLGR